MVDPEERVPVLVVGGALTGLSSAVFLGLHGVRCLLVERHPDLLVHPRLRGVSPRAVEAYRQAGLEPAIRDSSFATGEGYAWVAVRADTLAGEHTPAEESDDAEDAGAASPCSFAPIDQDRLEVLLRGRAIELGADVRYATELVRWESDGEGVSAVLRERRPPYGEQTVRADYLIAADGAGSPVRERLGIGTEGPGVLFHTLTTTIEADLGPALRGRPVSIAYLRQPRPFTILMAHDDAGRRWVFATGYSPEHESIEDYTDGRVVEMVRAAAGLPDADVMLRPQIPGTGVKVLGFPIGAQVARDYRAARVFLVGDAAKIVPPTGGLGGSTGIQDAHNLAWKLAAVLAGQAGPALLETYHAERHPVGLLTMRQALARFGARMGPDGAQGPPPLDYSAIAFGYQYRSTAVLGAPDDGAPPLPASRLAGQPGTRAPHLEITVDGQGRPCSTIDLYGRRLVLLAGPGGAAWVKAADAVSQWSRVPVDAYRFGVELGVADGIDAAAAHGISPAGAVLVRPDGFVAWRAADAPADPASELERALRAILRGVVRSPGG
jgi:putative polyketide hydroxylase